MNLMQRVHARYVIMSLVKSGELNRKKPTSELAPLY